jgi:hypothetical protein
MMFPCQNVDPDEATAGDDEYLRADYSISCSSDRYYVGCAYAIAMIFVYPIGVPVFYFWLLYSHQQDITSRFGIDATDSEALRVSKEKLGPIRFLFEAYKPEYWG